MRLRMFCEFEDKMESIQRKFHECKNQQFDMISKNTAVIYELNGQCARLRSEFEASEACRQHLELELSVVSTQLGHTRKSLAEAEMSVDTARHQFDADMRQKREQCDELSKKLAEQHSECKLALERNELLVVDNEQLVAQLALNNK